MYVYLTFCMEEKDDTPKASIVEEVDILLQRCARVKRSVNPTRR